MAGPSAEGDQRVQVLGVSWLVVLVITSPISLAGIALGGEAIVRKLRRSASLQFLRRVGVRLGDVLGAGEELALLRRAEEVARCVALAAMAERGREVPAAVQRASAPSGTNGPA